MATILNAEDATSADAFASLTAVEIDMIESDEKADTMPVPPAEHADANIMPNPKKRGRPPGKTNKTTVSALQMPMLQTTTATATVASVPPQAERHDQEGTATHTESQSDVARDVNSTSSSNLDGFTWEQLFYQLFVYKSSKFKHIPIPIDYTVTVDGKICPLGQWVDLIREAYAIHGPSVLIHVPIQDLATLTEDRIKALNALGFSWERTATPSTGSTKTSKSSSAPRKKRETTNYNMDGEKRMNKDAVWDEMYQRLVLYHSRFGHCHIPPALDEKTLEDESTASLVLTRDMSLRSWVARQRSLYKGTAVAHGKPYVLKPERRALLAALGFDQYVATGLDSNTAVPMMSTLSEDIIVKSDSTEDDIAVMIDSNAGESSGLIIPMPIPAPDPATMGGFKMRFRKNWNEYYQDLIEYKNKYGDCNVPQFWATDRKLGKWVAKQRYQYNLKMRNDKTQLTDTRMMLLDQIGFNWGGIRVGMRGAMIEGEIEGSSVIVEDVAAPPIESTLGGPSLDSVVKDCVDYEVDV